MAQNTPEQDAEQQKDIDERVAEFGKRHLANVEELAVDFVTYPQYVQIAPEVFGTHNGMHIVDKKYAPVPSPLTEGDIAEGKAQDEKGIIEG